MRTSRRKGQRWARELQEVATPPAPDREALRAYGQGRAQGRVASDAFGTPDRSRVRESAAPIGGMASSRLAKILLDHAQVPGAHHGRDRWTSPPSRKYQLERTYRYQD